MCCVGAVGAHDARAGAHVVAHAGAITLVLLVQLFLLMRSVEGGFHWCCMP